MRESGIYAPVSKNEGHSTTSTGDLELENNSELGGIQPFELEEGYVVEEKVPLFEWSDPWILSTPIAVLLVSPILLGMVYTLFDLSGRLWMALPFCLHWTTSLTVAHYQIASDDKVSSRGRRLATSFHSIVDIVLFGYVYQQVWIIMIEDFFTEPDGTEVIEWSHYRRRLVCFRVVGWIVLVLRLLIGCASLVARLSSLLPESICPTLLRTSCIAARVPIAIDRKERLQRATRRALKALNITSLALLTWAIYSTLVHFVHWSPPKVSDPNCDPLDETECWLPFPSFHHLKADPSTSTGWRVNLQGNLLPLLKGGISMNPHFLNELDGFSTMAPMLFYIPGLKEAHEAGVGQLQGPGNIAQSTTRTSITLLLDVTAKELVPHSAEIDYLDAHHPLVMVFPAQPLFHNRHYALAVFNATDSYKKILPQTPGMTALMGDGKSKVRRRYLTKVIPALELAANWFIYENDKTALQLLFDFHTISEESQLGPIRRVRDATLQRVESPDWQWSDHVRVNRITEYNCINSDSIGFARTIDAEMDVPWFLETHGPGSRGAILDDFAVESGEPTGIGIAKFVAHIPCTLRSSALGMNPSEPLIAVMEYGHGLFGNRYESSEYYLQELASLNGYIVVAMDWRGMSQPDLFIVIKTLLSKPRIFQAVRDNLIQGYACKFSLQHFIANGFLSMDWTRFRSMENGMLHPIPLLDGSTPSQVFYGNSQGGILGAGYACLSGPTKLIDRAILGVPGTPFALIMTRSLDFRGYDAILLLNFYNNRHVRLLLNLVQQAWDSVEGAGVLAQPVNEPIPRLLLQAGLGDTVVTTFAAEALARGLNASTLQNNPRDIYGIPSKAAANETWSGPNVTFSELLYKSDYLSLPKDDLFAEPNAVHICVRKDKAFMSQIAEFINTGRVIDPCEIDSCLRIDSHKC